MALPYLLPELLISGWSVKSETDDSDFVGDANGDARTNGVNKCNMFMSNMIIVDLEYLSREAIVMCRRQVRDSKAMFLFVSSVL